MRILTGMVLALALAGMTACGQSAGDDATKEGAAAPETPAAESPAAPAAPALTPTVAPGELEIGFDRPGADVGTLYDVADAEGCRRECEALEECRAFTWVQPGIQADTPVCWLKDRAPPPIEAEWATSGVMPGREPAASE